VKNELIVLPHDPNWNQARLAWNLAADQQPAAPGAGALASIDGQFPMFAVGMAMTPEMGAAARAHLELVQNALARWNSGRTYLNFSEKRQRGERLFGDVNYRRLQAVKAAVDPDDVLRSNHPVRLPAAEVKQAA